MASIPLFQNSSYSAQRKILLTCFSIFMMLYGMNYSVILSSLWFYLKTFNSDHWYLGIVLSVYSGSGALASPVVGHYADVCRRTRLFTFVGSLFFFIGLVVYSLPFSQYCPLAGVAIAGVSGSIVGVLFGELARITTFEERTRFVAFLEGSRLVGFVFGPCINIGSRNCEFIIGEWKIFYGNCPTVFLSLIWFVFSVIIFLCQTDITVDTEKYTELNTANDDQVADEDDDNDYQSGIGSFLAMGDPNGSLSEDEDDLPELLKRYPSEKEEGKGLLNDLFRVEVIVLLWLNFFMSFVIASASTLAPLIAKEKLNWTKGMINILFIGIGLDFLLSACLVAVASRCLYDRHILLFSIGLQTCFLPILFLFIYFDDVHSLTIVFVVITFLVAFNGPCFIITVRSLMSKISSENLKSFNQGTLITATSCAELAGPLVGALVYENLVHFTVLVNVVNIASLIGLITVYKKFKLRNGQK